MPDIPTSLPDSPHAKPNASAIPAVSVPVRAAVPRDTTPHTISPEALARAITYFFENEDVIWSTNMHLASETGKANFLSILPNGRVVLTVIKPGIMFRTGVFVDPHEIDLKNVRACIAQQGDWAKDMRLEGFLPEGMHEIPTEGGGELNKTGGDGATFVFNRTMVLRNPRGEEKGLRLRWIGKHTNPAKGEKKYQVNDTLTKEEV